MDLTVVLPTYNEKENILILIPELEGFFREQKIEGEVIVADDSSPDGTSEAAEKLNKKYGNVIVSRREKKEGLGAALRDAYDKASGDLILSMDSDLSLSVDEIPKLLDKIEEGFDLVVGSRHRPGGVYKKKHLKTFVKNIVSQLGNAFTRLMVGGGISDYSLNFRVMRRRVWENIKCGENLNTFLLEMIIEAQNKGFRVAEVPVTFKDRIHGQSKTSLHKQAGRFLYKVVQLKAKSMLK